MAICPHCQNKVEVMKDWNFFECNHCGSSLQLNENQEIEILKQGDENYQKPVSSPENDVIVNDTNQQEVSSFESEDIPDQSNTNTSPHLVQNNTNTSSPLDQEANTNIPDPSHSTKPSNDLSSISEFANTETSQNLYYDLQVTRIDSVDVKGKIKDILRDTKLKLDLTQVNKQVDQGYLSLKKLHSVKTTFLVRKLSSFPVEITWSQKPNIYDS